MPSRAPVLAALTVALALGLPAAAQASNCVGNTTASIAANDGAAIGNAFGVPTIGKLLIQHREYLEYKVALVLLAKQDLANIDTLDAFIPESDTKKHAVLESMRAAKEAQIRDLEERAVKQAEAMHEIVASFCKDLDEDARRAPPPVASTQEPPGGWPPMPTHHARDDGDEDSDFDRDERDARADREDHDDGADGAALLGALAVGAAIAAGTGGHESGGHHGRTGCH